MNIGKLVKEDVQKRLRMLDRKVDEFNDKIYDKCGFDYSQGMPSKIILPDAMRKKYFKYYQIYFIVGILLWYLS